MSDCSDGGRRVYRRPELIHQVDLPQTRVKFRFANADPLLFTFSRYLEDGTERVVRDVEVDGTTYAPRPKRDWDDMEVD